MMLLRVETIGNGLHPNEVVVAIKTTTARERLVVPRQSIINDAIEIGWPIRIKDETFLVELPRETQTGGWRVWVPQNQVFESEERMRA